MIKLKKVHKKYENGYVALENINLVINKGEFVYIVGPSGSGKSTLLNCIFRSEVPSAGMIYIDNYLLTDLSNRQVPFLRRNIGMIFQDFKLLNDRTIFDNIALPLQIIGYEHSKIVEQVKNILSKLSLENRTNMYPFELSGGEQQKVCVARAIIKKPKIILADEPTGNLDPSASDDIIDLLENESNSGTTIIMATHNYPLIENRIKYFLEINDGKLIS